MTKKQNTEVEALDDDVRYKVTMLRTREVNRVLLRKGSTPTLKGKVIKEIAADVGKILPLSR